MILLYSYITVIKVKLKINYINNFKLKMYKSNYKANNISQYLLKADYGPTLSKDRGHVLNHSNIQTLSMSMSYGRRRGGEVFLKF